MDLSNEINKDEFLDDNYPKVLNFLKKNIDNLETKIKIKGIFATQEEKDRLEFLQNHYADRIKWYERQLIIEKKIL